MSFYTMFDVLLWVIRNIMHVLNDVHLYNLPYLC
jgi:hypothetical protein